ncbi:MAG: phosphate acyltransferase PlsX [Deltaproteobacteria bacterium]|nr:phosphate acyltransferase PlsX [Deltaproteobacteria bacterium]
MTTIALDVMGGDHAPDAPLSGAAHFSLQPDCPRLVLVGDARRIEEFLAKEPHDHSRISVVDAPNFVAMDADPKTALDAMPDASVAVAARLVKQGRADALVSAGNTGGVVLACARTWERLAGVPRAALGAVYPTEVRHGEKNDPFSLILDAGLTLDVDADALVAFAVMGSAYASRIAKNPRPRVGLLSNGSEAKKGTAAVVEANAILSARTDLNFIGNVEGLDIPKGTADVVITGGFTGNIVLKMLEGVAETMQSLVRTAADASLLNKAALMMLLPALKELKKTTDWQQYGGAPVLGFEHVCIKAHGRSSPRAIKNAIKVACRAVDTHLVQAIREGLSTSK